MLDVLVNNRDLYLPGFLTTIKLFVLAGIGSVVLGTVLAAMRVSPVAVLRTAGTTYVTLVRNTPLTLVFFFFAFAYPRLGLVEASENKIGTPVDQLMLFCFHYDPHTGKYSAIVMNIVRLAGALTVLIIGLGLFWLWRWDLRHHRASVPAGLARTPYR